MTSRKKSRKKRGYQRRMGLRRRGSGNRGGFGRAGHGKRSAQKKSKLTPKTKPFGFTARKIKPKIANINLTQLNSLSEKLGLKEIELPKTKVLGNGVLKNPLTIKALSFTKTAKEKIEKAGGKTIEF